MNRIFSGVQPSGFLHIGNYFGAIKQWIALQKEASDLIFCVVDLHAITVPQKPDILKNNIYSVAAWYLALGVDLQKSTIFVQSTRPEHTELMWILNCLTSLGELNRMTQFKDKAGSNQSTVSSGLYTYPVLMAADILLYQATHVPVGEDQKQHVELARDIAERFNRRYNDYFTLPEPVIKKTSSRIMGLDDPSKKMSKSASSPLNYIALDDSSDTIRNKIKKAVTDSGNEIKAQNDKPAISNLLNIYHEITGQSIDELEKMFQGKSYGEFKESLAEVMVEHLNPIQEKYQKLMNNKSELANILSNGSQKIEPIASKTIREVKQIVGLGN